MGGTGTLCLIYMHYWTKQKTRARVEQGSYLLVIQGIILMETLKMSSIITTFSCINICRCYFGIGFVKSLKAMLRFKAIYFKKVFNIEPGPMLKELHVTICLNSSFSYSSNTSPQTHYNLFIPTCTTTWSSLWSLVCLSSDPKKQGLFLLAVST